MTETDAHQIRLRELGEQLVTEYGGAVPPGRVLTLVHRADRLVAGVPASQRASTCEAVVRRMLTDAIALETGHAGQPGSAWPRQGPAREPGTSRDLGPQSRGQGTL